MAISGVEQTLLWNKLNYEINSINDGSKNGFKMAEKGETEANLKKTEV